LRANDFDAFGLYRYASGLNPARARRLFADLALRREAGAGEDLSAEVYADLRRQTVTDGVELPNVDLDRDIGGYADVKTRLREELIDLVRRKDTLATDTDIRALEALLPRGVIFHGPPGTGKTFFAKALATALDATVIIVSGPELKSKWVGESEENLRRVFRQARATAPSVVVFDEIDAFAHQRGSYQGSGVEHSMVNQLLTEMDGFRRNEMVFVVGTTNLVSSLDGALLRPGRFEFVIEVPAPDAADRAAIARIYSARLGLGLTDALIDHLVRRTEGMADDEKGIPFSGDHLHAVCRALKRQQLREGTRAFTPEDLDRSLQRKTRRPIVLSPEEEKVIAVHEAGHALIAMLLPRATPPERICITQDQEGALGYVLRAARARPYVTTEEELRADICVGLGGQVAERMVFREVSGGAHADLQRANTIARAMVEQWGMSRGMGPRVVTDGEREHGSISPTRRDRMDAEVESILREELTRCESLLRKNAPLLEALWTLLLEKKVLDGAALRALAEPKGG
jgi:cell division protease FtsH